jgi:hypothetical protein
MLSQQAFSATPSAIDAPDPDQSSLNFSSCSGMISEVADASFAGLLRCQVEYYMSEWNLSQDPYLLKLMDMDGWVLLSKIAEFPRMDSICRCMDYPCRDLSFIAEALLGSETIEMSPERTHLRPRARPLYWAREGKMTVLHAFDGIKQPADPITGFVSAVNHANVSAQQPARYTTASTANTGRAAAVSGPCVAMQEALEPAEHVDNVGGAASFTRSSNNKQSLTTRSRKTNSPPCDPFPIPCCGSNSGSASEPSVHVALVNVAPPKQYILVEPTVSSLSNQASSSIASPVNAKACAEAIW